MDELDRRIVNGLQGGFPLSKRPYAEAAAALGTDEATLLGRLARLLAEGILTRFGPMYDIERLGGAFCLCAMRVPAAEVDRVARQVNARAEVAHHYERESVWNLWFVLATEDPAAVERIADAIEHETGYAVMRLPREAQYFVELRLTA